MPITVLKRLHRATRAAYRSATTYAGDFPVIVEVMLIPKYASVADRRELFRTQKHPKKYIGLPHLKELSK